jgi:hypothetical protein
MIMKPLYFALILVCAVTFHSCIKDNQTQQVNAKILPGVWELRAVSGGMLPYDPNNFKPGNGHLWAFTQTKFASIYKDSSYRKGTYSISPGTGTDLNTGRKIDQIIFNNDPAESFELTNDTLKFYYGFIPADGAIAMYVKIAEDTAAKLGD